MTYTEDFWSRDFDSAEEAARALWEDENGPSRSHVELAMDDEDWYYPYDVAGGNHYPTYYTGDGDTKSWPH